MNKERLNELKKIRRDLHKIPEIAFREYKTSEYIYNYLKKIGIRKIDKICKTGIVAIISGNNPGKTLALRADMDALPLEEHSDIEFVSKHKGVMHACGHDGHMAMLLLASKILNRHKNKINGHIKLIFQPGEEMERGAKLMVEEGILESPNVDAILGLHLWPDIPKGMLGVKKGVLMASLDGLKISVQGKACHGAMPYKGIDAISVSNEIYNLIQRILAHELNPLSASTITIGKIAGGTADNIIADQVIMEGTIRALNSLERNKISDKIKKGAFNIAKTAGATVKVEIKELYPITVNNEDLIEIVKKSNINDKILELEVPTLSSEDFSFYLKKIPGAMVFIGTADKKHKAPLHHSKFNFDETALLTGLDVLVNTTYSYLQES